MWEAGVRAQLTYPSGRLPQPEAGVQVGGWQLELQRVVLGAAGAHIRAGTSPSRVHIPETWCSPAASSGEGVVAAGWMGVLKVVRPRGFHGPHIPRPCAVRAVLAPVTRLHGEVESGQGWGLYAVSTG